MAKAKTPKPSAVKVDQTTTPPDTDISTGTGDPVTEATARAEAAEAEVRRLSDYLNLNRHEQVAAYRNGRDSAVQALKEIVDECDRMAAKNPPPDHIAAMLDRARHAIIRAQVMP